VNHKREAISAPKSQHWNRELYSFSKLQKNRTAEQLHDNNPWKKRFIKWSDPKEKRKNKKKSLKLWGKTIHTKAIDG
jgi:hypothetical protein